MRKCHDDHCEKQEPAYKQKKPFQPARSMGAQGGRLEKPQGRKIEFNGAFPAQKMDDHGQRKNKEPPEVSRLEK